MRTEDPPVLAAQLRMCVGRLRRRLVAERDGASLPMGAMAVLCALERFGAMSVGELAEHEHVRPPSMTRSIDALERRGCVCRAPHPDDGRVTLVALTERGRGFVVADRGARDAWLACRLRRLTAEERAVVARAVPILEGLARRP